MYESYFGLTERPFSIAPDPQYLYMSARHKEAMAHLSYGLSQGGCFIVLTGEVGTGKTTLCRNLMTDFPENVDLALILNANINESELLQTICDELKIEYSESHSQKQLLDLINKHLLETFANNRNTVLIIDEAQLLSRDVLEQVRLLTNLETTKHKLLQIILIGQPELSDMLMRKDLRQLAQRVTARYHLGELKKSEIEEYVNYRLGVAGCKQPLFSSQALSKLHQMTEGIPRKINVLADHALLSAYALKQRMVDSSIIKGSAKEVFFSSNSGVDKPSNSKKWWLLLPLLLLLNIVFWWAFIRSDGTEVSVTAPLNDASIIAPQIESDEIQSPQSDSLDTLNQIPDAGDLAAIDDAAQAQPELADISSEPGQINEQDSELQNVLLNITDNVQDLDQASTGSVVLAQNFLDDDEDVVRAIQKSDNLVVTEPDAQALMQRALAEQTEFGRILDTSADLTGRITAFRSLADLWGESLPSQVFKPMCEEAAERGLECVFFSNWDQLLRFNRPAVLVLNHAGQLHRVIVEVVDDEAAEVRVGDSIYRISVEELRSRWQGNDGLLLWRPSEAGSKFLQLADRDPLMPIIRGYLNRALEQSKLPTLTNLNSVVYDQELSEKVLSLQQAYAIIQDAKIGNETYLLLNELVQPSVTPVLLNRSQETHGLN
ncbi:MAG: AAA family ATPase [Acidiferrobacterales bacterium]|nr:AAA family ATPase [Acidiferrobacterales bacterium]